MAWSSNLTHLNDDLSKVYPKAAKRSIPCTPLLSLNVSMVIIAAAELFAYNQGLLLLQAPL